MLPTFSFYARALAWLDRRLLRRWYTDRVRRLILRSFPFWFASIVTGFVAVGYESCSSGLSK
ncbi:hypothetical protein [Hymenobacter sp. YC55]|uniref:hypothetical protein n=1 Tax=Hymenobacter sp. YC55 TaxID=3034019 RepID=UPI0023F6C13D|nr:hypothetical protein [Hymenobacter sp. YC55]MDF7813848.1 hypothetical protein [Hymenobacter sp. YC55]